MNDPRNDPRARRLLAADPDVITALTSILSSTAGQASSAAGQLNSTVHQSHGSDWEGGAADQFRSEVGKLPKDLQKVATSYTNVCNTLNAYEGALSEYQSQFRQVAATLADLHGQLSSAQNALQNAQLDIDASPGKQIGPDEYASTPPTAAQTHALNQAQGQVTQLQQEITQQEQRGFKILGEFSTAVSSAKSAVTQAAQDDPPQHDDFTAALKSTGDFFANIGKGIFTSVTGTFGALQNFANDSSFKNFVTLAGDVGVDASIVALAAAAPEALAGLGAVEAGVDGAAEGAAEGGGDLLAQSAKVKEYAEDVGQAATAARAIGEEGEGKTGTADLEALSLLVPNVSDMLGVGDKAVENANATSEALEAFQKATAGDTSAAAANSALKSLTSAQQAAVKAALTPTMYTEPAAVAAAAQKASAAVTQAQQTAGRIGDPVDFLLEHAAKKPAIDAGGAALNPTGTGHEGDG